MNHDNEYTRLNRALKSGGRRAGSGRKLLPEGDAKSRGAMVRLTVIEHRALDDAARASRVSMSQLIRRALQAAGIIPSAEGATCITITPAEHGALTRAASRAGVSITEFVSRLLSMAGVFQQGSGDGQ